MATNILRQYLAGTTPNPDRNAFNEGLQSGALLRRQRFDDEQNELARAAGGVLAQGDIGGAAGVLAQGGDIRNALALQGVQADRGAAAQAQREKFGERFGQFAGGVLSLPEEQQEAAYRAGIGQFEREARGLGIGFEPGPMNRDALRGIAARYGTMPGAGSDQLQEIYDPASPTGTRFVRRSEAIGQPGKPPSGQRIDVGPDGQISITSGRGVSGGALPNKSTTNKIQGKALDSVEMMDRLNQIQGSFRPEFQQLGTRLGAAWSGLKSRVGIDISPQARKQLQDFAKYRRDALENLNRTLNELSGAAVNESEFKRISAALPNPGTGLFDGDDPVSFQAKLTDAIADGKRAIARYNYLQARGFRGEPWEAMSLEQMDEIIDRRGEELEAQARRQFPNFNDQQVAGYVRGKLGEEFGIGAE